MTYPSVPLPYFNERPPGVTVDTIVVHSIYSGDTCDTEGCLSLLEKHQVAAHYIISEDGEALLLVPEEKRAWHAGLSRMPDGRENVNDFSIGIELVTTSGMTYREEQYLALGNLIADIYSRWPIRFVLGHDVIAPTRKVDPGPCFQWFRLQPICIARGIKVVVDPEAT